MGELDPSPSPRRAQTLHEGLGARAKGLENASDLVEVGERRHAAGAGADLAIGLRTAEEELRRDDGDFPRGRVRGLPEPVFPAIHTRALHPDERREPLLPESLEAVEGRLS